MSEPVRRKLIPLFGAAMAAAVVACGSDAGPAAPAETLETLRLSVRVHVLSSRLAPLDAQLSDAEVVGLVDRANQVWALPHVACTSAGNLMAPGCASQDRTRLTALQIQAARTQAAEGRPS